MPLTRRQSHALSIQKVSPVDTDVDNGKVVHFQGPVNASQFTEAPDNKCSKDYVDQDKKASNQPEKDLTDTEIEESIYLTLTTSDSQDMRIRNLIDEANEQLEIPECFIEDTMKVQQLQQEEQKARDFNENCRFENQSSEQSPPKSQTDLVDHCDKYDLYSDNSSDDNDDEFLDAMIWPEKGNITFLEHELAMKALNSKWNKVSCRSLNCSIN